MEESYESSSENLNSTPEIEDIQAIIFSLKQENQRLKEENESLKKDFKQTLQLEVQNKELLEEKSKLQSDLRSAKASIEKLESRLALNIKINEELKSQINNDYQKQNKKLDVVTSAEVLDRERRRFAKEIAKLNEDISSREDLYKKSQEENIGLHNEINKILKKSQEKFNISFPNTSSYLTYLEKLPDNNPFTLEMTTSVPEAPPLFDDRLVRKVSKLQSDLKTEQKERIKAEQNVEDLKKQFKDVQKIANEKVNKASDDLLAVQHKMQMAALEFNRTIDQLNTENAILKQNNLKLQQRLKENESELNKLKNKTKEEELKTKNKNLQKEIAALQENLRTKDQTLAQIKNQNDLLQDSKQSAKLQIDNLERKLSHAQSEIASLNDEKEALCCEKKAADLQKTALEETNRSLETKNKSLSVNLHQAQTDLDHQKEENEKNKQALVKLEDLLLNQKREIQNTIDEKDKLLKVIQKQNSVLLELEKRFDTVQKDNKTLQQNLQFTQDKLNQELEKPPVEIEIPAPCWMNKDFPKELCIKITDFVQNKSLEQSTKLRNVMQTIANYYNQNVKDAQEQAQKLKQELDLNREKVDEYLTQIVSAAGLDEPYDVTYEPANDTNQNPLSNPLKTPTKSNDLGYTISTESIVHDCIIKKDLLQKIRKAEEEKNQYKQDGEQLKNKLEGLINKLEVKNVQEADEMITKLYETINSLKLEVKNEHANLNRTLKLVKVQEKKIKMQETEREKESEEYEKKLHEKSQEMKQLKESLNKSEKEIQNLQNTIKDKDNDHKLEIDEMRQDQAKQAKQFKQKLENAVKSTKEDLENKQSEIIQLKDTIASKDKDIQDLKRVAASLEAAKRQKDVEIQHLLDQQEEAEQEHRLNSQREKECIKQQYDKCIAEMKKENQQLSESHNESTSALQEANRRVNDLTQKLVTQGLLIDDLKSRIAMVTEETERQIRITEMKTRSALMSQEMHYKNLIEDNKSEFYTEKRKVIGFVAQQFRQYFDAHLELDENCLKSVVRNVRLELDRLSNQESSLRKIMGLSDRESLEDSAAKLVLDIYHAN